MKAKVTCPNGHRFHVDASHLGKTTRCPQEGCGIEFVLEADPDSPVAEDAGGQQAPAAQPAAAPPTMPIPMSPQVAAVDSGETRKGMALGAMVCGIIGILGCFPIGIAGLILGIVAVSRVSRKPAEYGGRGMAIAGICTGGASILLVIPMIMMASILLPSLARARELSKRAVCAANLRGIGQAMRVYANDFNEEYPPNFKTLLKSGIVTKKMFVCPSSTVDVIGVGKDLEACYAYIKGQGEWNNPSNVLVYEKADHHGGEGGNVLFCNGTVEFIKPYSRIEELARETKERMKHAKRPSTP